MTKKFCLLVGFCLLFDWGGLFCFFCREGLEIAAGHDRNTLKYLYYIFWGRELELTEWAYGKLSFLHPWLWHNLVGPLYLNLTGVQLMGHFHNFLGSPKFYWKDRVTYQMSKEILYEQRGFTQMFSYC